LQASIEGLRDGHIATDISSAPLGPWRFAPGPAATGRRRNVFPPLNGPGPVCVTLLQISNKTTVGKISITGAPRPKARSASKVPLTLLARADEVIE
jgi:hypothetical protein